MGIGRKCVCLCLCLLLLAPLSAYAAEETETDGILRDLIAYYFQYGQEAAPEIENQLEILTSLDPEAGATWRQLMDRWAWINAEMPVNTDVLPDGLPTDDSLCIVVLGFGLNGNGSMKQELIDRLEVALASAEKYPECYVLCTGGETARVAGVSEAGQMGSWLLKNGLHHNRLILETASLSTTENARNSLTLLWRDYPQVKNIAIVSSDYHIRWGSAVFSAMNLLHGEENQLTLAGNAGCETTDPERDSMYSQAWGISILADLPFDGDYVPQLYMPEEPAQTEAAPAAMPAAEPAEIPQPEQEPVAPVLLGLASVLILLIIPKKRKQSGSD